jgi:hypothetical protein
MLERAAGRFGHEHRSREESAAFEKTADDEPSFGDE